MNARCLLGPLCCGLLVLALGCRKNADEGAGGGPADTTEYALKASLPRLNSTVRSTHESKSETRGEVRTPDGKLLKDLNKTRTEDRVWSETILAVKAGDKGKGDKGKENETRWTKLKVVFERCSDTDDSRASANPKLAGRTLLVERRDFTVSFDPQDAEGLSSEADRILRKMYSPDTGEESDRDFVPHRDFLPDKPVRVGQTWTPPTAKMAASLGAGNGYPADPEKTTATARLVRVYDKGGHRFGAIEITATFPAKSDDTITVTDDTKLSVSIHYDGCIDGTVCEATAKVKVEGHFKGKGPRGSFDVKLNMTMTYTETEKN